MGRVISFYNRFSAAVPEEAVQGGKRGRLLQESNILQFCGQHLKTLELPHPDASATFICREQTSLLILPSYCGAYDYIRK